MTAAGDSNARREGPLGVIGTGMFLNAVLAFLLGSVGILLFLRPTPLDAQELEGEVFLAGRAPEGFELEETLSLPKQARVLIYRRVAADAAADDAPSEPAPADSGYEELVILLYGKAESARKAFLAGGGGDDAREVARKLAEWREEPDEAWRAVLAAEDVAWSRWRADYRIVRSFREEGEWRDSLRIDLSQTNRGLLLFAQYPVGVEAPQDDAGTLARLVRMQSPADSGAGADADTASTGG